MADESTVPGRKARREGIKKIVQRLNFCVDSKPPLNFEAAEICYQIWLKATFVSYPTFIQMLGWSPSRLSKLTSVGRNRTLMSHQNAAPNASSTLYQLSLCSEAALDRLFREGRITQRTTEPQARALRKECVLTTPHFSF